MTCVLSTTPWHHFSDHIPWLPMNTDTAPSNKPGSHAYVSTSSDTRKSSTSSGKKRASRAGTRSVTTLSAAQLERKRANDREAQRAIRQRTKDHIDQLERTLNEVRGSQEANEKIVHVTQQRNRDLEEENAYLRSKLSEAGFNINLLPTEHQRVSDSALLSIPSVSPGAAPGPSIQRPPSASTPSSHSATTQSSSRHDSWQHPSVGFVSNANPAITTLPSDATIGGTSNLTTWRSHENGQNLQDPLQAATSSPYHQDQRVDWPSTAAAYPPYAGQEPQRPQQYETAPSQAPVYQPPAQGYAATATPQPSTYHTQITPRNEFPSISVSTSPSAYEVQAQTAFQQPLSFQVAPMQVSSSATDYSPQHGRMQPPPLPNSSFHTRPSDQSYATQPIHPPMQYRDETTSQSFSVTQYHTA